MIPLSKMVKCKTCGAEIAKSANRCPQCGAKQHQAVLAVCALIIVFTFVGCFAIIIGAFGDGSEAATQASEIAPISVSASELWKVYSENEVNADNLYKNKLVSVTGTITDIGKDVVTGNPCISLDDGSQYSIYPIQCFFTSDDKGSEALAALRNGQEITICGNCSGTPVITVQISDCYLATP